MSPDFTFPLSHHSAAGKGGGGVRRGPINDPLRSMARSMGGGGGGILGEGPIHDPWRT